MAHGDEKHKSVVQPSPEAVLCSREWGAEDGARLKDLRGRVAQEEFGRRVMGAMGEDGGGHRNTIGGWESGKVRPPPEKIEAIAKALGVPLWVLCPPRGERAAPFADGMDAAIDELGATMARKIEELRERARQARATGPATSGAGPASLGDEDLGGDEPGEETGGRRPRGPRDADAG
jgi:transcriptional regulator with XRE-family HTH domain